MQNQSTGGPSRVPLGQRIGQALLRLTGWTAGPFPDIDRAVIAGGPHTSNWDGVLALVSRSALQKDVNVMIKTITCHAVDCSAYHGVYIMLPLTIGQRNRFASAAASLFQGRRSERAITL